MITGDAAADALLSRLLDDLIDALGDNLFAVYLFGSATTGNFEPGISDVDLAAILERDLAPSELAALDRMHRELVAQTPEWDGRVEVVYVSSEGLRSFRDGTSAAARISPGEPFHAIVVDPTWLIDWYQLREVGVTLFGPPATEVVPVISKSEYVEAIRQLILTWPAEELAMLGAQAYAILTMCRGLRTVRTGEYVSKREAARWASEQLPEYAELIRTALLWREERRGATDDATPTRAAAAAFVAEVASLVE
jgi:aminoglycoside adenylyltransferase-like protein/nucleotidyltransferase-like protein